MPAPFDGIGIYSNYTYADSSADLPFGEGSTQLPGTSRSIYNVGLSYEKHGINARVAYNYRSNFIQSFDDDSPELNVFWDERASLDFSASYALTRNWRLFGEVNNINDARQVRSAAGCLNSRASDARGWQASATSSEFASTGIATRAG